MTAPQKLSTELNDRVRKREVPPGQVVGWVALTIARLMGGMCVVSI